MTEYVTVWKDHEPTKLHWGVPVVRCKDCVHSLKEGTLCMFFAAWAPIAGGDEYEKMPALAEPDGFCAWGERRGDAE